LHEIAPIVAVGPSDPPRVSGSVAEINALSNGIIHLILPPIERRSCQGWSKKMRPTDRYAAGIWSKIRSFCVPRGRG